MFKTIFISTILMFSFQACSSKKVNTIDYKTQQQNSQKALKEL